MRLTLKAAGLLDVDAGEIIRPGVISVDDGRIVGIGGTAQAGPVGSADEGDVLDLGDAILLPGLMDMEVNLLMGGRERIPACPRSRTIRPPGCCERSATHDAPCVRVSPRCEISACSSRPVATCSMSR